jgi:hypothetical protein
MDEQQVRLLVRQAIARHMGAPTASDAATRAGAAGPVVPRPARPATAASSAHASFARFHLVRPAGETECLIEPTVTCNHCGHCQCYGH